MEKIFHLWLLLLASGSSPILGCVLIDNAQNWTYNDVHSWGIYNAQCNGYRQSPISLHKSRSTFNRNMRLDFWNYHVPFAGPISISNNGYWLELNYTHTANGWSPTIITDDGAFITQSIHFHWGASHLYGSDHAINGQKFAAEMHIVHMNTKYSSLSEALRWKDGITVLAVMLTIAEHAQYHTVLDDIFEVVPFILAPRTQAHLNSNTFTLNELLGGLNKRNYFKYAGSLTTPPCAEAVTFFVLAQPLAIRSEHLWTLWQLHDWRLQPMVNNFRPLQRRNRRPVYFKQ